MEIFNFEKSYQQEKKNSVKGKKVLPNFVHIVIDWPSKYQVNFGSWAKKLLEFERVEVEVKKEGIYFAFQNTPNEDMNKLTKTVSSTMVFSKNHVTNILTILGVDVPDSKTGEIYEAVPIKIIYSENDGVVFKVDQELYNHLKKPKTLLQKIGIID